MNQNVKPILKWAGGKTQMLPQIIENLPNNFKEYRRYIEPFIGAGAVFLYLANSDSFEEYVINDINEKLINLYKIIRDNCTELLNELSNLKKEYLELEDIDKKELYYYNCREEFNLNNSTNIRLAGLFIFLNKTCFNGLYRENSKGLFNVPFGKHKTPGIYSEDEIKAISNLLNIKKDNGEYKVTILNKSFEELYEYVDKETFVYFDPPYRPVTLGGFTSYDKSGFNDNKQIQLKEFYQRLDEKKCGLMLSNSDPKVLNQADEFFDKLYSPYTIKRVSANRIINSKASARGAITELLIMNYKKENSGGEMNKNFNTFLSQLKKTNATLDYFTDFCKVNENVNKISMKLNQLNYLIGKTNLKDAINDLFEENPKCFEVLNILIAVRDNNVSFNTKQGETVELNSYFTNTNDIFTFFKETGLEEIFINKNIKNLVDYVFGIEVGLDTNARKNRGGKQMAQIVAKAFNDNNILFKEEVSSKLYPELESLGKDIKRFDFVIEASKKTYLIETNFYSTGGSKLNETARSFTEVGGKIEKIDNFEFVWITDGEGWLTAKNKLEEAYEKLEKVYNLTTLQDFIDEVNKF